MAPPVSDLEAFSSAPDSLITSIQAGRILSQNATAIAYPFGTCRVLGCRADAPG